MSQRYEGAVRTCGVCGRVETDESKLPAMARHSAHMRALSMLKRLPEPGESACVYCANAALLAAQDALNARRQP